MFLLFGAASTASAKGTDFDVKRMPLSDAISLLWGEVLHTPFMLAPELAADARLVTLHIAPDNDEREFITRYLDNMHIRVSSKKGIDYISPYVPHAAPPRILTYTYTPKYRDVAYLSSVLGSSFGTGSATNSMRSSASVDVGSPAASASGSGVLSDSFMSQSGDMFVYRGTAKDIEQIKALLPEIDTRAEQVDVSAYVFEVSTDERNGSGLQLATKLLNSHFTVSTGTRQGYGNFIQFSTGSLDALYELFRTDSHFSLVSSPRLRVVSGQSSSFAVGASVPTLGSVSYENGTPVQAVEYRNTGIQFNVKPVLTSDLISMNISQQLSDYAQTTTGVNNTPTFTNRQIMTNINMKDGDIIVLSGLAENKDNTTNTGLSFLPKSWSTKSGQKMSTDLLIVLQAGKVKG
ncbi:type II secretion system protein GspD [Salmonella enterica]|nr:type II secretion system protein GspD [Salmonella enterica]EEH5466706.1 type II secretion system protein GspD [Salmonella enterica]EEH7556026.1 type II secretion system protein GspD [Salmonella enterica]EEO5640223.1 type II secretion system protein GspD [Salmonella enterica]EEQ0204195.1 type II secretion system protein GspD [Salmonella enterica]